jgi:integrase/recombinase XerD
MKHQILNKEHFKQIHNSFERSIRAKGYKGTLYHQSMVQEFFHFVETKGLSHVKEIKSRDVVAYYEYLKERPNARRGGGLSDATIRTQLFSLRLLFDYLIDTKVLDASPVNLPRFGMVRTKQRSVATAEEIKLIYKATETRVDKAILALAYGCGLRRAEIEKLDLSDVQLSKGMLLVREGKNGKTRVVPLSDGVITDLKEYVVNERTIWLKKDVSSALLLDRHGERIKHAMLNTRLKRIVLKTGNRNLIRKEITLHCLRHSIATHLLDNGASIDFVRRFLGHEMLDTTHIYSRKRKQRRMLLEQFEQADKAA